MKRLRIDWSRLWQQVTREFQCDPRSIHGPSHWRRVERNGLILANRAGANIDVVRLFAILHDSRREHDGSDNTHGSRAATYAGLLRGNLFELSDAHFELLQYACTWHTHGKLSKDPTIGTCWDADRLDLGRVRITPRPAFMSTEFGREIASRPDLEGFLEREQRKRSLR